MSTVTVARVAGSVAIASDSRVTFRETRLPDGYEANVRMFSVGDSVIGTVGGIAQLVVLQQALASLAPEDVQLHSRQGVFETFVKLHPRLKERFFLNTKEQDSDPYESSQFLIFIANRSGTFGIVSDREVFEFQRFWAIGSGRRFADGRHAANSTPHLPPMYGCKPSS